MTSTALRFLERVLPNEGYKCATIIGERGPRQRFFLDLEELCAFILSEDALGRAAYHACASFKIPQMDPVGTPAKDRVLGRTAPNALANPSPPKI